MNEKKIKDTIDRIEPSTDVKERMYQNILKKAQQQTSNKKVPIQKKHSTWFIRYALPLAACFCLLVVGMTRLLPNSGHIDPIEGTVMGTNPFTEVKNADDFQKIGITLDAPENAQNVTYAIIDNAIASITFESKGKKFVLRASNQNTDFSGLNGEVLASEQIDEPNHAILATVQTHETRYYKVSWTIQKTNYCLYGTDGADTQQVIVVYNAMQGNRS